MKFDVISEQRPVPLPPLCIWDKHSTLKSFSSSVDGKITAICYLISSLGSSSSQSSSSFLLLVVGTEFGVLVSEDLENQHYKKGINNAVGNHTSLRGFSRIRKEILENATRHYKDTEDNPSY